MVIYPNAKINVGLHITGKRADGFHNLETVFYPVKQFCDILEFLPTSSSEQESWSFSGLTIDVPTEKNLIYKVYRYFREHYDISPLKVHLHKQIPMGAGLGGGSSDVGFFINGLNEFFSLHLSVEERQEIATRFGSDCAFFIENKPVFATEKGNHFQPVEIDFSNYYLVIVYPHLHINTAQAYASISQYSQPQTMLPTQETIVQLPWLKNDFEDYAFSKFSELKAIKEILEEQGAVISQMTGSGSAIYGLFNKKVNTSRFAEKGYFVWRKEITK